MEMRSAVLRKCPSIADLIANLPRRLQTPDSPHVANCASLLTSAAPIGEGFRNRTHNCDTPLKTGSTTSPRIHALHSTIIVDSVHFGYGDTFVV